MRIKKHIIITRLFTDPIEVFNSDNISIDEFKALVIAATIDLYKQGLTLDMVTEASKDFTPSKEDNLLAIIAIKTIAMFFHKSK